MTRITIGAGPGGELADALRVVLEGCAERLATPEHVEQLLAPGNREDIATVTTVRLPDGRQLVALVALGFDDGDLSAQAAALLSGSTH